MVEVTALTSVQIGGWKNPKIYREGETFDVGPDVAQRLIERHAVKLAPAAPAAIEHGEAAHEGEPVA